MSSKELNWIISEYCPNNGLVLDAGCGDFGYSKLLKSFGSTVMSIDISNYDSCKSKNYNFLKGSIENLPFLDNSFDLVVCFSVMQLVRDDSNVLLEFKRVLKSDGILIITVPTALSVFRLLRDLEIALGFYRFPQYNLPHYHYYTKKYIDLKMPFGLNQVTITGYTYNFIPRMNMLLFGLLRLNKLNIIHKLKKFKILTPQNTSGQSIEVPEKMPSTLSIAQRIPLIADISYHYILVLKKAF